jgi:hypothetical protein
MEKEKKILHNSAKCLKCGDIIESKYRHDFVSCSCGEIFVDGGLEYCHWGANDLDNIIDMCEYEEDENA